MPDNTCACCGAIIPEGRHICLLCEGENEVQHFHPQIPPIRTNGDRIRAMTDEELALWIKERYVCDRIEHGCPPKLRCYDCKLNFMKTEVSGDVKSDTEEP